MGHNTTDDHLDNRRYEIQHADYPESVQNAILDFLDAYNPDSLHIKPPVLANNGKRDDTLAVSSRLAYASTLHRTAKHHNLLECTARNLNRHASERLSGKHESAKDSGLSKNTVHQNQIAWRKFYRFHHHHPDGFDTSVDPDDITLVDREETSVDERDMFTPDEIQAMRDATQHKRDRALLEMLIYTGQRHNALRTLNFEDVRPKNGESGILYLPEGDGMKGAKGKRPLLGAQKAAKDWRRAHPTQEPKDAFFTHIYEWDGHDTIEPGDQLSRDAIGRIPKRIADRAGVEKPANPHQFRHYFVTKAISKHGMSMDTVRHLIGHADGSRELERTYQHLVDDDHIENAELDMGIKEQREESLTPPQCPTCNEPLEPSWSVCPNCEAVFGPDANRLTDEVQQKATQDALEAVDEREKEDVREILEIARDPEVVNQLVALSNALGDDTDDEDVFDKLS